jgi:hypothetical protein
MSAYNQLYTCEHARAKVLCTATHHVCAACCEATAIASAAYTVSSVEIAPDTHALCSDTQCLHAHAGCDTLLLLSCHLPSLIMTSPGFLSTKNIASFTFVVCPLSKCLNIL